jgi:hypothetical protein
MLRVATMEGIQPTALKDLNEVLFKVLAGGDKIRKSSLGGVKTAAEMINLMGTAIEGTVIESIRSHDADLAQKKSCLACHATDKKLVGPSYKDVAAKYAGQKDAAAKLPTFKLT